MRARHLEQSIPLLEQFIHLWKDFYDILTSVAQSKKITEDLEKNFLTLKTEIAHQQARLSESLGFESHFTEEIMAILSQIISLRDYLALTPTQVKRIDGQWHHLFILMHGQLGKYQALTEGEDSKRWVGRFFKNPVVVIALTVVILLVIYFVGEKLKHPS